MLHRMVLVCCVLLFAALGRSAAQPYYFFNGFPDAAQPGSWYNNANGLGLGETAFIAGQTYIVETGRTAVINSTWNIPAMNIIVRSGALLVVVGDINAVGGAAIDVQSGGILRIHNNPNITAGFFTNASYNNATVYYTGNMLRSNPTELPNTGGIAANIVIDNSANVVLSGYISTINGNLSVSAGTLRVINANPLTLAGTTTIARGGMEIQANFAASTVVATGEFILGNGTECFLNAATANMPELNLASNITFGGGNIRTNGSGRLRISGSGTITGRVNVVEASVTTPRLAELLSSRTSPHAISLGTNIELAAGGQFQLNNFATLNTNNFQLLLRGFVHSFNGTLNVNSQGLLEIDNNQLTGTGTLNVFSNARLRTFEVLGNNAVNYADSTSILEYFSTNSILAGTASPELPATMNGSVIVTKSGGGIVELDRTTTLNGNFTIAPQTATNDPTFELRSATNLTFNGKITTLGNTPTLGTQIVSGDNSVTIGGDRTELIQNFSIRQSPNTPNLNPYLQAFTMNRPARLELSRDLVIDAVAGAALRLARGVIVAPKTATGRVIVLSPSSTAIEGGSATSYIEGPLQRSLSITNVLYPYPIGSPTEYMPMSIISPPSVTPAPSVVIAPFSNVQGGFVDVPVFTFKDNRREWRMRLASITPIGPFQVQLADTDLVVSNVVVRNTGMGSSNFTTLGGVLTGTNLVRSASQISGIGNLSEEISLRIGNTTPPPTITRVSPLVVASGSTITLEGTNFVNVSRVQIASTTMSDFSMQSPTRLTATLPSTVATATPLDNAVRLPIIVRAQGGTTASVDSVFYVFTPTVSSFTPSVGGRGTAITIRGFRFSGTFSTTPTVTFGGIPAQSVTVLGSGELRAIVPQNATTGVIRVTTPGGSAFSTSIFTFIPPPRITAIVPNIGREGDIIVIRGTAFDLVQGVRFGGIAAQSFTVNSPTQISAIVARGSTGTVSVIAVGGTITSTEEFTFAPPPTITRVTPTIIGTTGTFELQGTGFVGVREVRFTNANINVTSLSVQVLSSTRMLVAAPRVNLFEEVNIKLTTAGGETATAQTLTLVRSPEILGFTPLSGTTGTLVQIIGRNFLASTISNVQIAGATVASFEVVSDSLLVSRVGRINPVISSRGTVQLTSFGGTVFASTTFANIAPPPQITEMEPAFGIEGTLVTVRGANFNDANVVRLVNTQSRITITEFRVVTNGQLSFIVPRNATTGTLEIQTSGGVGMSPVPFTFLPPPVIHVIEPPFGVIGSNVVLQGENLRGVQEIRIGDAPVGTIVRESPTQLTFSLGNASVLGFNQPLTIISTQGTTVIPSIFSVVTEQQLDSLALVNIYQRTGGANWLRRQSWLAFGVPISAWQGVVVDTATRRVVQLSLPQNNMAGAFPLALQFLTRLRSLDWQGNRLTGRIPAFITSLRLLDTLRLGQNRFSQNSLPDSLGNLTNLRVLNMSGDSLTGAIPRSLARMTNLQECDLSNNLLQDSVPQFFTNLASMRVLRLNGNRLVGTIPSGFGATTLAAALAKFTQSANATPLLEELNFADNQLTGAIPPSIGSLTNLRVLSLANNRLEGALTGALVQRLTTLATLNLGGNRLSGTLPVELGLLRNLRFLSLRSNQFIGTIPEALGAADNLETLWLDNNQFGGGFSSAFLRLTRLQRLDLSNNQLSSVARLPQIRPLNYVNLAGNRFDFGSLEDIAQIDTIIIAPQDSIAEARTVRGIESLPLQLSILTGGTSNRYQWFRETPNGAVPVSPLLRDGIFQFIYTQASSGTYSCRVTNVLPEMRSLTLQSRPITVIFGGLPPPPTQVPELLSPDNGASFVATNATLTWTFTTDASVYNVQVSTQPNFMPILLQEEVRDTVLRLRSLPYSQDIYWRVQGRNIAGITPFSAPFTFQTSPRNIDILATSVRFAPTPLGDTSRSVLILTNTSTATLVVQSLTIDDGENSFRLPDDVRGLTLRANAEQRLDIEFTPRTVGAKAGTVLVQYSQQGAGARLQTQNYPNLVRGTAIPIKIRDIDFDTVRVNRSTITTMLIENKLPRRAENVVNILSVRPVINSRDAAFSIQNFTPPVAIYPGDGTGVLVQCSPTLVGRPVGTLEVRYSFASSTSSQARIDTGVVRVGVRASAVIIPRDSLFLEFGIRPVRDSVPPGGSVDVEVFIKVDSSKLSEERARVRRVVQNLNARLFEGSIRYNPNVLSLIPNLYFEELTNATAANAFQRASIYVPRTLWNSADSLVIARVPFRVVSGNTNITPLIIEEIFLGPDRRTPGQRKIFIDQSISVTGATQGRFIAGVCEAGGLRLTTTARAVNLTAIRPNPVQDAAELTYAVREDGFVALELIDLQGNILQTLVRGDHAPGEYLLTMDTKNLPSGTYFLRLRTPSDVKTQKVQVVK